jgi:hypothetical protein
MRHISLFIAAALCAVSAQADDEHRQMPPIARQVPWLTGADLLRKLDSPTDTGSAQDYIRGVYDATEHHDWCAIGPDGKALPRPRPVDLQANVRAALASLPAAELHRNAGDILRLMWQDKSPCPTSAECCDG